MTMKLYDTMSRDILDIAPMDGQTYRFYCCGPTVYGPAHIGNFRTFVLQDVFRRTIETLGLTTCHVRNLTDVDDKTIRDSMAQKRTLGEFTDFWRDRFHADCAALNLLPPHIEPSAVAHIPHQITMIEELIERGHAYASEDGSVYYRVSSFPQYGRLSRLDSREIRLGASATVASDEYEKDSVADFVLWKARRTEDGDNYWESPWGQGRPGWHLECSTMCRDYLGDSFDLHSGGVDLVFPHHENEIAQTEACTGHSMAQHWFHLTHLLVDGGKMSKSANNFYTLSDLTEAGFSANELRFVLISAHYRQPLNFVARDASGAQSFPALLTARQSLRRIGRFATALAARAGVDSLQIGDVTLSSGAHLFTPVIEALSHDLNTPDALGQLFTLIKKTDVDALSPDEASSAWAGLKSALGALGLTLPAPEVAAEAPAAIVELAQQRWQAKTDKNWAEADRLRQAVTDAGWEIKDSKEGYELCPKN